MAYLNFWQPTSSQINLLGLLLWFIKSLEIKQDTFEKEILKTLRNSVGGSLKSELVSDKLCNPRVKHLNSRYRKNHWSKTYYFIITKTNKNMSESIQTQLAVNLPESLVKVASIQPSSFEKPLLSLHMENLVSIQEYPNLSLLPAQVLANQIVAYLYPRNGDKDAQDFKYLESIFSKSKLENSPLLVMELSSPGDDFGLIYLLTHSEVSTPLSPLIQNAKMAIFKFDYQTLFGNNISSYVFHIRTLKVYRHCLVNEIKKLRSEVIEKDEELKNSQQVAVDLSESYRKTKVELEEARECVTLLKQQLDNLSKAQTTNNMECLLCQYETKNIIFLPCGHIQVCKKCIEHNLSIPVGVSISSYRFTCIYCKSQVSEAREVFF